MFNIFLSETEAFQQKVTLSKINQFATRNSSCHLPSETLQPSGINSVRWRRDQSAGPEDFVL